MSQGNNKKDYYQSPRWSGEILDCSMPMTFDTYSSCSFNCLYCFSYFQKSHSMEKTKDKSYQRQLVRWVNPDRIKELFNLRTNSQFNDFIKNKIVMQWGGLADQFDMHEKKHGITLNLMEYFKNINYPLCFSTKAVWVFYDERYRKLFKGQDNWNMKISIINLDPVGSKAMERGCPSPQDRLKAGKEYTKLNNGGFTLRFRPFIIGFSDRNNEHLELIKQAKQHGANAVSTEFFCLETRADERLRQRYNEISKLCGFDVWDFYKKHSKGAGYRRLNYNIKKPYIKQMYELCEKLGLRFYVSDAHHKEKCNNGSCCGLPKDWNYSKGQFTEALMIAKEKGVVKFSDIEQHLNYAKGFLWSRAIGFNTNTVTNRVKRDGFSMFDYIREQWNYPNVHRSPYKYFEGILIPKGLDNDGNVIYEYNYEKAKL